MTEMQLLERVTESSPVVVLILLAACVILWRQLREEILNCRSLHAQSIESNLKLTAAIDRLAERIEDAR